MLFWLNCFIKIFSRNYSHSPHRISSHSPHDSIRLNNLRIPRNRDNHNNRWILRSGTLSNQTHNGISQRNNRSIHHCYCDFLLHADERLHCSSSTKLKQQSLLHFPYYNVCYDLCHSLLNWCFPYMIHLKDQNTFLSFLGIRCSCLWPYHVSNVHSLGMKAGYKYRCERLAVIDNKNLVPLVAEMNYFPLI